MTQRKYAEQAERRGGGGERERYRKTERKAGGEKDRDRPTDEWTSRQLPTARERERERERDLLRDFDEGNIISFVKVSLCFLSFFFLSPFPN